MERLFAMLGLMSVDGRKSWAFLALLGGCGLMTAFAAVGLWIVRADHSYVFYLALAAHVQIGLCLTGFTAMFVRRDLSFSVGGNTVEIRDGKDNQGDT